MAMNREQKRMLQRQGQIDAEGAPVATSRRPQPKPARPAKEQRTSPAQFLREVRSELRKVAWPTRSEVVRYATIVFVTLVIMTALIAVLDYAFGEAIFWVIER